MKKITFTLFISSIIILAACNKDDSSNPIDNQIENCTFENSNASIFIGSRLLNNLGVFTFSTINGEIIEIRVVACEDNKFHDLSFAPFNEGSVIEDGVYNAIDDDENISINYKLSQVNDNTIPAEIFNSVDGVVEIDKGKIIFNVICQNYLTSETIKLSGDISYL